MRILIQRVKRASVAVEGHLVSEIKGGLLLLVGIGKEDTEKDLEALSQKVLMLRIFEDQDGKMNLHVIQKGGEILSVPQFTLYADTRKGNRPGFDQAADPGRAKALWERFNMRLREGGIPVKEGVFGAHMDVSLVNNGPVTLWLDSKEEKGGRSCQ